MPELVVVVPSRGRPHTVAELAAAFRGTCTADTKLLFAVDDDDPSHGEYVAAAHDWSRRPEGHDLAPPGIVTVTGGSSMVWALNSVALGEALETWPSAVAFMGDDHRPRPAPRSGAWDRSYLDALAARPGIVYGDDLIQGPNLPTQCAMSVSWVRALGHMAPPVLAHLCVDDYWLRLGRATGGLTYLPDVVVEHVHPLAGKAEWDDGHLRVNRPELYERDCAAFEAYWAEFGPRDVAAVLGAGADR